jgi:putative acetyltransferase
MKPPVPVAPDHPQALALMAASEALMTSLYPAASNHFEPVDKLKRPNVRFVGVWDGERLAGIGAVKLMDDEGRYGEIKRVFVDPAWRGRGVARAILADLEAHLRAHGASHARLETGNRSHEAITLYRALGYVERAPFGAYAPDPLSLFMEKAL